MQIVECEPRDAQGKFGKAVVKCGDRMDSGRVCLRLLSDMRSAVKFCQAKRLNKPTPQASYSSILVVGPSVRCSAISSGILARCFVQPRVQTNADAFGAADVSY